MTLCVCVENDEKESAAMKIETVPWTLVERKLGCLEEEEELVRRETADHFAF